MSHPEFDAGVAVRRSRIDNFFDAILDGFPSRQSIASVVVTHILPDRPALLRAIGKASRLSLILAKPRSIDKATRDQLVPHYPVEIAQQRFTDPESAAAHLSACGGGRPIIVLDMGGYFASVADRLMRLYAPGLLGIVEDTENGHQKYAREAVSACPVISVARSPLKNPEDFLVGQSIVFSAEALLRERGDILHGRTACVIGYGKLGRSIANLLQARHVRTVVFDLDQVKRVEALSHGFAVTLQQRDAEITSRKEFRGHITCGAIVVGKDGRLLMINHRSLGKWLFPGGHLEPDDLSLRDAALREITEETGVPASTLSAPTDEFAALPIQVDCHVIPANPSKAEPEHRHFDFRFVFQGEPDQLTAQEDEVSACAWVSADSAPVAIRDRLLALRFI